MFGGDYLPSYAKELKMFLDKMRSPIFKRQFEKLIEARIYGGFVELKKVGDKYQWQKKN